MQVKINKLHMIQSKSKLKQQRKVLGTHSIRKQAWKWVNHLTTVKRKGFCDQKLHSKIVQKSIHFSKGLWLPDLKMVMYAIVTAFSQYIGNGVSTRHFITFCNIGSHFSTFPLHQIVQASLLLVRLCFVVVS